MITKHFSVKLKEINFTYQTINDTWGCQIKNGEHSVFRVDKDMGTSLIKALAEYYPDLDEELSINIF